MRDPLTRLLPRLLILAGILFVASPAQAWWNKDWQYRVKITADASPTGANITEPIGRTQILVRLFQGNFDFANLKPDGSDLRFVAGDDKTPLHYHLERFNATQQEALAWVDVPDLAPGTATPVYIYWGNEKATDGSDAKGTYDPDQVLDFHFNEENGLPKDATGFASNALTAGTRDEAGIIGYALKLDRDKPLLRIGKTPSLAILDAQAMTFSMWIQPAANARTSVLYSDREGNAGLTIGLDNGVPYVQVDGPGGTRRSTGGKAISTTGWTHVAVEAADKFTVYVDGKPTATLAGTLPAINGQMILGGSEAAGAARYAGLIDEFEIAKVARPAGALQVAVASEGPDGKLVTFDQPEASGSDGPGFLTIILRSVTVDAWVIIGILMVLAVATWYTMYTKTTYLNRLGKANKLFLAEYRQAVAATDGDHMAALNQVVANDTRAKRHSALQRLAKIGVAEMDERLRAGRLQPGGSFSPQTLAAIQAAMETGLSHEQHKLGSLMVVLSMAISGGPFIGLLGTVVGVMITFAAIAAAGDVNVNAIAPGIAAALLATAAGMFVAIPAMFAYNYLLTRSKTSKGDMEAFVNETVTRMGEARAMLRPQAARPAAPPEPPTVPSPPPMVADPAAARAEAAARRAARAARLQSRPATGNAS